MNDQYDFVYVNQDGSARELSPDEREYLAEAFEPTDGGRPYIKTSYKSRDGWGSISGFIARKQLPDRILVEPVNPAYVPPIHDARREMIEDSERVGDIVNKNADGSITCARHPDMFEEQRFALFRKVRLARQREREKLAKHPDYIKPTGSRK